MALSPLNRAVQSRQDHDQFHIHQRVLRLPTGAIAPVFFSATQSVIETLNLLINKKQADAQNLFCEAKIATRTTP